jgi:hypothetical protein
LYRHESELQMQIRDDNYFGMLKAEYEDMY